MSKALRIVAGVALIAVGWWNPGSWAFAAQLIMGGALLALGAVLEKSLSGLNRLRGQSVMIRSAVQPQERVYGLTRKSGIVTWYDTSGDNNKYLWFVITVCEHEIEEYTKLWIDEEEIDISTEIDGSGYVTNTAFVNADSELLVKTGFYLGEASQTADAELVAEFSEWSTDHKGNDCAYFWVRIETDTSKGGNDPENPGTNIWYKGWPRDLSVTMKGAKVYDPRLDDLNGGTGAHRVDTESTWEWSDNSVLCRTDYLRSERYGSGYTSADIDWAVVATEADFCEDLVSLPDSETQARYTMNGVISMQDTPSQIIQSMQTADYGTTLFKPGSIEVLAGGWDASSHTIDSTWIAGSFAANSADSADSAYNAVRGQYSSLEHDYAVVEFNPRTSSAYETEDGVGRVWRDILLPFTTDELRAQRMAILTLKKSRQQTSLTMQCNFRAELVDIYQVVTIDLPGFQGLYDSPEAPDTFRVVGKSSSTDGTISLQLREEVESDWTYTVPELASPPIIPSVSRPDAGPPPPSNLATTTVVNGILLSWDLPALDGISQIEVYSSASNARATATLLHKTVSETFFHEQGDGVVNYYWILARGYNGLTSIWEPNTSAGVEGTAGISANIPDFAPGYVGGTSDFVYALNMYYDNTTNDGEIRVVGNTFEHPDGTSVTLAVSPISLNTYYEGLPTGRFFIMFSATSFESRFGGTAFDWGSGSDTRFGVVTYDDTNGWRARANTGTYYDVTVIDTDCIIAICEKTAASGGINTIQVLTGGLAGVDGADGADGSVGVDARAVNLIIDDQTFEYDTADANPSPSSGTVTATALNTTGTVWYEFFLNDVSQQNTTGNTYAYTPPASYTDMPEKLEVQIREDGSGNPILARDQITVSGLKAGSDAITVIVSNEAHTLPTTALGVVTYTGSGTDIEVWQGTTQVPYDGSSPYASPSFRISVSASPSITPGSASTPSTYVRRYGDHNSMTADNASITYSIIVKNSAGVENTFTKKQTFAKSTAGDDGSDGADGADGIDGADGFTVQLSNSSAGISADSTGAVVSAGLSATDTTMKVFEGTTALDFTTSVTTAGEFRITSHSYSPTGFAHGTLSGQGTTTANYADISSWSDTSATVGYMDIVYYIKPLDNSATIGPFTIRQSFTITKEGGTAGGQDVDISGGYIFHESTTGIAGWHLYADGSERRQKGATITAINTWLNSGSASDYEVRATKISGQDPDEGTMESWITLGSTTKTWRNTITGSGQEITVMSVKIRNVTTGFEYSTTTVTLDANAA